MIEGRVVAAHGRHWVVRGPDGTLWHAVRRGKSGGVACGDTVQVQVVADAQAVIEEIGPRATLLYRSDAFRVKLLAANVTQLWIVVAVEPSFSEDLLGRALVAAEAAGIRALILLNKIDLASVRDQARSRLARYASLGYGVLELSIKGDPEGARARLGAAATGQRTVLLGQSGMGKSSLVNLLVPDAGAATGALSAALHSGRHTTTDARLFVLPESAAELIDTPGFQEFGLAHLPPATIANAFPEIRPVLGGCRFYNCTHLAEPGCAVRAAVEAGAIAAPRYALFAQLVRESKEFSGATTHHRG